MFFFFFQATLNIIRNVVLEVQLSGQKQVLGDLGSESQTRESQAHSPALLQGGGELAYLTHEGLFISDALNEFQQQVWDHSQDPVTSSRGQQSQAEVLGCDSASEVVETPISRELSFMYVCGAESISSILH